MSLRRLCKSLAWKMLPCAEMETKSPGGIRLPIRDKGEWGCLGEIFIERVYEPYWEHLEDVRGWVDLGCNVGFFSCAMLDHLTVRAGRRPRTRAFLGDANETCVGEARRTIRLNDLAEAWECRHVVVGPPGGTVTFSQFKYSVHSSIFSRQKGEKTFRYRTTDLPALFSSLRDVFDLIKIDIEGGEVFLFRHHGELLGKFRYGLCEWHAPDFDGDALREAIGRLGFELLAMRSQAVRYDPALGHSWRSPFGMALWRNPFAAS